MTFLAPLLLSLAAFAGVPLLVHLLRRRVTRRVNFPAVQFLLQTEREHSRERTVRNRLLLLLRLLAVLALVAAVARPFASIGGAGHPPLAVAIVLDQSMSTRAVVNGRTQFSQLQDAARSIAGELAADDRAWLITSGGTVVAGDGPALSAAIAALQPAAGRGDLVGALRRARALVDAGAPRTPVIAVLSDGQRSALEEAAPIEGVPLVVYAPPSSPVANRVVHRVSVDPVRWAPGGRILAEVSASDSAPWRALLGSRTVARGTAAAAAFDAPVSVTASAQAADTGWLIGRVETDVDDFPGDNVRAFAVLSGAPPSVTVRGSAGPFVAAAVDALVEDGRVERRAAAGGRTVTIAAATELVDGATVLLAPSNPLQVVAANRALERAGVPWRFGAALQDSVELQATPAGTDLFAGLTGARVWLRYRLTRVTGPALRDSGEVLATAGGTPWLVSGTDYALVASPLQLAATNAPVQAAFVPWLRDLVSQRLGGGGVVLAVAPADTIDTPLGADGLEDADGTVLPITGARLVLPDTTGVFLLRRGVRRVGALEINPELSESDMTAWTQNDWQPLVRDAAVALESVVADATRRVYDRPGGRSIAWPLVLLALLALVAEALVARGLFSPAALTPAPQT